MRRARLTVLYGGKDISSDIAPFLVGFTYTDNAHGKADTISIDLEDTKARFVAGWFPEKGAKIEAVITCEDWFAKGDRLRLHCGVFEVDQVGFDGPPDVLSIEAVSAATTSNIRREKKTKAYENTTLEAIAGDIAKRQGLELVYESGDTVSLGRVDQRGQSDLEFLQRQAEAHGLKLKVTDDKLVLFDDEEADSRPSSYTIRRGDGSLVKYRFQTQSHDSYDGAKATYWSPEEKELYAVETAPKKPPKGTGQTLTVNERFENQEAAEKGAAKRLRSKNKKGTTGSITLMGHPGMQAGLNVSTSGFGKFDGKYSIETARHAVNRQGGYVTTLELKQAVAKDGGDADDSPRFSQEEKALYAVEKTPKTSAAKAAQQSATQVQPQTQPQTQGQTQAQEGTQTQPQTQASIQGRMKTPSEMASDPKNMEAGVKQRYQEAVKSGDTAKAESWKQFAARKGISVE